MTLLRGLSLELRAESVSYLAGENGSGKTTLLRTLSGEMPLISGKMEWFIPRSVIGYMPQHLALSPVIPATVQDILRYNGDEPSKFLERNAEKSANQLETGETRDRAQKKNQSHHEDLIQEWIDRLNLHGLLKRRYAHLSMGQQKRVLFGRAMCSVPRFLILDEPLANLDDTNKKIILDVLNNYCREKKIGMLITSHDPHWLKDPIVLTIHSHSIYCKDKTTKEEKQDRFVQKENS